MKGSNNRRTRFEPRVLRNEGPEEVGQYYIEGWQLGMKNIFSAKETVITVSLILTRDFFNIFMVTYLPTILMNVCNQGKSP